jgi:hypothetical protein
MRMLHATATEYGQRPSSLLGFPGGEDWISYQIDQIALLAARTEPVQAVSPRINQPAGGFASLKGGLPGVKVERMAIPPSGIW